MPIPDEHRAMVNALAEYARDLVKTTATVTEYEIEQYRLPVVEVHPHADGAAWVSMIGEQWIVVEAPGELRWELNYEDDDLAIARRVLRMAVRGDLPGPSMLAKRRRYTPYW